MQLYIPKLGDKLVLTAPWGFTLFCEKRNLRFIKTLVKEGRILEADALKGFPVRRWNNTPITSINEAYYGNNDPLVYLTLPCNSELIVDRIFIRKGASNFNSATFISEARGFNTSGLAPTF